MVGQLLSFGTTNEIVRDQAFESQEEQARLSIQVDLASKVLKQVGLE